MAEAAHVQCATAVRLLSALIKGLPDHVPLASTESRISEIFKKVPEPLPTADPDEHWTTFNRRMELLYGNDVHGADCKLLNITQGPFGMGLVVGYIQSAVEAGHLLWEAALPKFARLVTGVQNMRPSSTSKTPPRMTIEEVHDEEVPAPTIQKSQHTKAKTSTSKENVPGKSLAKQKKTTASGVDIWADTLSTDDAEYILPKCSRIEEDLESEVFDSNNEEIISTMERGKELVRHILL
ncbi:hypothetical protein C8J55DRAFT_562436 [Lentinula edodes]|uniref:Uncharacterized protein n=1 Tax=Lentinula lateritia TaxID=40482 RepID=A0A9W9DKA6_9AGAR|nr:hypothetical protein C8J55DRAFT_562436 [Lentinula edodes]